jgi:hypothetical protein
MAPGSMNRKKASPAVLREIARTNAVAEAIKGVSYMEEKPAVTVQVVWPAHVVVQQCPPAKGRFDEFREVA